MDEEITFSEYVMRCLEPEACIKIYRKRKYMRRIWLTEEDYRVLKSFIAIGAEKYGKAFSDGKISKEDYHNMDKFLGRFYEIKKLRSRYDKTKAEGYKGAHDK